MDRSKLSAIVMVALMISQYSQGAAAAETAKGPLTAAEKTHCRAQLAAYNDSATAFNVELTKLRALEAEFDALRAEVKKDEAAMAPGDNAAMESLNAKIGRNNELVEQHTQMSGSIKAKAIENTQRSEQFFAACENRPAAPPPPPLSPPPDSVCGSANGPKDVRRQIDATFVEIRANEKQRQDEVERVADARAKAQSWSKEKRSKVYLDMLMSPRFAAFEREKQPYVRELMSILVSKSTSPKDDCRILQRIAATLPHIKAINTRQYAFMADAIRVAK